MPHGSSCDAQGDVERLQGSLVVEHTLARVGAEKLWRLMREEAFVPALGALTGNQAMQQIRAGLKAVYCSGWQVGEYQMLLLMPFAALCAWACAVLHIVTIAGRAGVHPEAPLASRSSFAAIGCLSHIITNAGRQALRLHVRCCRWPATPMWRARCTLTRACTPATVCLHW